MQKTDLEPSPGGILGGVTDTVGKGVSGMHGQDNLWRWYVLIALQE
jgi:hypothetical protein